jgi:hypothetical protein
MLYIVSPHVGNKWVDLQAEYIKKYTDEPYELIPIVVDSLCPHILSLSKCLTLIKEKLPKDALIVEIDSDAFPIEKGWPEKLRKYLAEGNEFVAVQRLENPNVYRKIAHPCLVAWYNGQTEIKFSLRCCNPFVVGWEHRTWKRLHRSNPFNLHQQLFGIYDDFLFHLGAGSRNVTKERFFVKGLHYFNTFFEDPDKFIQHLKGKICWEKLPTEGVKVVLNAD